MSGSRWRHVDETQRGVNAAMRVVLSVFVLLALTVQAHSAYSADDDATLEKARAASGAEAVQLYRNLAEKNPKSLTIQYEFAEAAYDGKAWAESLAAYQRCLQMGKKTTRVLTRIGQCHAKLKQHTESEASFRRALKADPDSHVVKFYLGSSLFNQQKAAEAVPLFESLTDRDDDWGQYAKEYLAYCYQDLKRHSDAITLLQPMVARAPKDVGLRWGLAKSLYKAKRYEEALPQLRQVADQDPKRKVAATYYIAASLEGLGKKRDAERTYETVATGDDEWSKAARKAARSLAGKPYRIFIDFLSGYDTGLVLPGDENLSVGGEDAFTQNYALFEGRVLRTEGFNLWLGGEHFGLHYPELHGNDYFEDTPSITFNFPNVGPFQKASFKYHFKYAQLDYQPYLREHQLTFSLTYKDTANRIRFGWHYGENDYFRGAEGLTGPDARFFMDFKRKLPLWEHQLRFRANVDYRWSERDSAERFTQRARFKYEAEIYKRLSGYLEATYRRDDYVSSQSGENFVKRRHRTDHRLKGEVRFEYMVNRHFFVNWGYQYESLDSRRERQEYGRHQMDAGFTISF